MPKVLAWSSGGERDNPVECEYLIMDHAPGIDAGCIWGKMDIEKKLQTMRDIVRIQKKLLSVRFQKYVYLWTLGADRILLIYYETIQLWMFVLPGSGAFRLPSCVNR